MMQPCTSRNTIRQNIGCFLNNINCQMASPYFSKCYSNVYPHFLDTETQQTIDKGLINQCRDSGGSCICIIKHWKAFRDAGWEREVNMDGNPEHYRLYGVWSYQRIQSCETHLPEFRRAAWFVCVVGAVDRTDGSSNCLMVGLYGDTI